jgi:hypothetical protein
MSRPFSGRRVASIRNPGPKVYCTLVLVEGGLTAPFAPAKSPPDNCYGVSLSD